MLPRRRMVMLGCLCLTFLAAKTLHDIQPVATSLNVINAGSKTSQITDRNGHALSVSFQNRWNLHDHVALYQIPPFLKQAFIASEDQHFYTHGGVDWRARANALMQNIRRGKTVRGASTITEQVVRLLNPRPRTLWSKWIETWEATRLEDHVSKANILEFYLNQLPYAANRRGVAQAAHYYFNRDLDTLSQREMLALVVLARAPSSYDLYRNPQKVDAAINNLAQRLQLEIPDSKLSLEAPSLPVDAAHFVRYIRLNAGGADSQTRLRTTLDAGLQLQVQSLVDERLKALSKKQVANAAALIADHETGEILAWVIGGAGDNKTPGRQIDAVTAPRQPGSALKPFLYAAALDKGWSPASIIDDSPLEEAIGNGLHRFNNYSRTYYGKVSLREALGNSLNIPAIRTILFVGVSPYLKTLHKLGFQSLDREALIYDEGLALGNGEVTLLELVQGYAALAHQGQFRPLRFLVDVNMPRGTQRVYSAEAASLIGNILSDPFARRLEFGGGSVLNLPVQTAVKTGTSTDYRDAWSVGYNHRYVVGVWMGNLNQTPMDGVTGSTGPSLVLRSIFAELNHRGETRPLYLSPRLEAHELCLDGSTTPRCATRSEYFMPGTTPQSIAAAVIPTRIALTRPTEGLQMALDPRIPRERQAFGFRIEGVAPTDQVAWNLDGDIVAETIGGEYLWPLSRGQHVLHAVVMREGNTAANLGPVRFVVK